MLEDMLKSIERKLEGLDDDSAERLENYVVRGLNGVAGVTLATCDVLSTGLPLLTVGVPVYDAFSRVASIDQVKSRGIEPASFVDDKKAFAKELILGKIAYAVGGTIPFTIAYNNEIISFVRAMIERM